MQILHTFVISGFDKTAWRPAWDYKDLCLVTSKNNKNNLVFNKTYVNKFQQTYVDDNKTVYNKYIWTGRETINLLIKRKTDNKKLQYIWEVINVLWNWHRIRWNFYNQFLNNMLKLTTLTFLTVLQNITAM